MFVAPLLLWHRPFPFTWGTVPLPAFVMLAA